jgi:hypothetical protein
MPWAFRELAAEGDASCLRDVAAALGRLQAACGAFRRVKARGPWAARAAALLARGRAAAGRDAPAPGGPGALDTLIMLDRTVDVATPMCTQLTYEGLLHEVLGLSYGQIRPPAAAAVEPGAGAGGVASPRDAAPAPAGRRVAGLNSADAAFAATRDLAYPAARRWVNEALRSVQRFRDAGMAGAGLAELRGFVADLRDRFARVPLHAALVDELAAALRAPAFAARQRVEAGILDERDELAAVADLIAGGEALLPVLRLLVLHCAVHGGLPRRAHDALRRDILNTYGHGHLLTLRALTAAGLLRRADGRRTGFSTAKAALRLLVEEGAGAPPDLEAEPADAHFAFAGYAPLSVRLVQQALAPGGWPAAATALAALPGPAVECEQAADGEGAPVARPDPGGGAPPLSAAGGAGGGSGGAGGGGAPPERRTVMVLFIGGVTHAEVAALRFLSRSGLVNADFVIATTAVVTGATLLASLVPPEAAAVQG